MKTIRIYKKTKGFTLVEIILATIILCGAVLAIGAISMRSLSGARLNRQYEKAATCLDRQLALIDYMGIDEFVESGQTEGGFGQFAPSYHWQMQVDTLGIDNLYEVNLTVSWMERKKRYDISCTTRLNGKDKLMETEQQ